MNAIANPHAPPTDLVMLAPSILGADLARLGEQIREAEQAGADRIHVDVMDGHFVPNISFGAPIIRAVRGATRVPVEVHLMIFNPDLFIADCIAAGADLVLVHWEGNNNLHRAVSRVKALGKRVGVAINPATPAEVLEDILPDLDQVLVMTVNPGFGNQAFIRSMVPKIRRMRTLINAIKPCCDLELDGGIDELTAPLGVAAGANVLVSGTAVFSHPHGASLGIARLRAAANQEGPEEP